MTAGPTVVGQAEPALPRSFDARYGTGVRRGLCLGGGGLFFVAWLVAYLNELAGRGLEVQGADRVVGTSAGSVVASALAAGHLRRIHAEISVLTNVPALLAALAPAADLHPSQVRAVEMFAQAADSDVTTLRAIGHAALAAQTPGPEVMRRNISLLVGRGRWPSPALHISCVDAYTGERCVVAGEAGVPVARAVAASSAVPGVFAPSPSGTAAAWTGA
jgi:NTE family protein